MNLSSCLSPVIFRNKFNKELTAAPCGKCEACRNLNNDSWAFRLKQEMSCWPYSIFFTLTYNEESCPRYFVDGSNLVHSLTGEILPLNEIYLAIKKYDKYNYESLYNEFFKFSLNHPFGDYNASVPVPFVPHLQKFVKLVRYYVSQLPLFKEKKFPHVRYFITSEYGETTFRPHYHGLFFFREKEIADAIFTIIRKVWRYGFCDVQFASNGAANYCASYLNSQPNLPCFFKITPFKLFRLFSKRPPIGSLLADDAYIKKLFESGTTVEIIPDVSNKRFLSVPIRPYLKNRLYPKCAKFECFDTPSLYLLYKLSQRVDGDEESLINFVRYQDKCQTYLGSLLRFYLEYEYSPDSNEPILGHEEFNRLHRLWLISRRVVCQAAIFNIRIYDYVKRIVQFYSHWNLESLSRQYHYQEQYVAFNDVRELLAMYPLSLSAASAGNTSSTLLENFSINSLDEVVKLDDVRSFSDFKQRQLWRTFNNSKTHHIKEHYRKIYDCVF